jgi:hypothetical protein
MAMTSGSLFSYFKIAVQYHHNFTISFQYVHNFRIFVQYDDNDFRTCVEYDSYRISVQGKDNFRISVQSVNNIMNHRKVFEWVENSAFFGKAKRKRPVWEI